MYNIFFVLDVWYSEWKENDCIYTGTPSGVGPVKSGDIITCGINNSQLTMTFDVIQ